MSTNPPQPRTHLFTVRLWVEPLADDQEEIRMQVQHVLSGETRYFRDWAEVVTFLLERVRKNERAERG